MKKLFSLLTVSLVFIATTFANTEPVPANKKLTETFTKHFSAAQSVSWNQVAMITTANFIWDGQYLAAHFSPDAKMLGISKNVAVTDLPLNMNLELRSYFEKYWISDIFEYATPGSDAYYVTLENADSKLVLKSEGGAFQVYKKSPKNI
ncbi:hypothetical protein [Flavitalea sp.]|nr:hypothetical protein [Flavitalea sp.]